MKERKKKIMLIMKLKTMKEYKLKYMYVCGIVNKHKKVYKL